MPPIRLSTPSNHLGAQRIRTRVRNAVRAWFATRVLSEPTRDKRLHRPSTHVLVVRRARGFARRNHKHLESERLRLSQRSHVASAVAINAFHPQALHFTWKCSR